MNSAEPGLVKLVLPGYHHRVVQAILLVMHGMEDEAPSYPPLQLSFRLQ